MNDLTTYAWLTVGTVPYYIETRLPSRCQRIVTIRALFWSLEVRTRWPRSPRGGRRNRSRTNWTLHIPLIERLRDAVWAAVMGLKGIGPQHPQS